jgi:hypothetical protein
MSESYCCSCSICSTPYSASCGKACNSGYCCQSMSTVHPNPSVNQNPNNAATSASNAMNLLNSIGKWGTVLTSTISGKPVAATASGVPIGAAGSVVAGSSFSSTSIILILVVVAALVFLWNRS